MSDTRPFPSRFLASIPALGLRCAELHAELTANAGLHDACVYVSTAEWESSVHECQSIRECLGIENTPVETWRGRGFEVAAAVTWRTTQGVYRFDADVYESLRSTDVARVLDSAVFRRLPERCVWIERDGDQAESGFFALLDDTQTGFELVVVGFASGEAVMHMRLPLDMSVASAVATAKPSLDREEIDWHNRAAASLASVVMYLCSDEPDDVATPSRINTRRIRDGKIPLHPTEHRVGFRLGAAFRKAKADAERSAGLGGDGKPLVPHIRRAHWHAYWVGAHDSPKRRRVVKWLPPIPVNVRSVDDLVPVIRAVGPEAAA